MPGRADIGPADFPRDWLPHLFMYKLESNGRFRCILIGTRMVEIFGRDETGGFLDELLPDPMRASRLRLFERAARDRRPIYFEGPAALAARYRWTRRLLLPLSAEGDDTGFIFGMALFGPVENDLEPKLLEPGRLARILIATDDDLA